MGGTTSRESPSGGSGSRGGVQHVTTKISAAESELRKQDSTSTSKKMNATARGHPATASETRQDLAGAGFLTAGATWLRDNTVGAERPGYFCGFPGCAAPQDKVRLQKIAGTKLADTATCTEGALYFHRKRADCARHFMGGEKGKPGRPAKVQAGPSRIPAGAVVHSEPCPAFLEVIHEVWGIRCAFRLQSLTRCLLLVPRTGTATSPT